jgi:hypothetical protein
MPAKTAIDRRIIAEATKAMIFNWEFVAFSQTLDGLSGAPSSRPI